MAEISPERERELSQLCTSCGSCCDGTLFHRARLKPEELEQAKRNGLRVIQDKGFELPCPRLENKCCQVYDTRPHVCKSFRCKLFARHRDEGGPIEARLLVVQRFRAAMAQVEAYGITRGPDGHMSCTAEGPDAFAAMEVFQQMMHYLQEDFAREPGTEGPRPPPAASSS